MKGVFLFKPSLIINPVIKTWNKKEEEKEEEKEEQNEEKNEEVLINQWHIKL